MAVVGKVGTYAQVQPIQGPDFGGMVKEQFDKLDAERKAKAAAKAKAEMDKQEELDKMSLGSKKVSNITEYETQTNKALNDLKQEYLDANSRGDMQGMKKAKDQLGTLNYAIDFTNKKSEQIEKNRENLNQPYYNQFWQITNSINELKIDRKYDTENKEHRITIYEDEEKTKPIVVDKTVPEILKAYEIPPKYNFDMLTKTVENFTKTYKPDFLETMINSGNFYGTKGVETILNDERIESEIRSKAKQMSSDVGAKAFYASEKGISLFDFYKMDEKQNKDAEDYFYNELKRGYRDKIETSISQKRSGSGKDDLAVGTPTLWESGSISLEKPETLPGRQPAKTTALTTGKTKSMTIASPTGKTLLVGSMPLDRVIHDAGTGRMYIGLSYNESGGQSMSSDGSGARESVSNKLTKWYPQDSTEFNAFKTVYNSAFKTNLQTIEDFKNTLFVDRGL